MAKQSLPPLRQKFFDSNNDPLIGGKVFTYIANTVTPTKTWADRAGLAENSNPIILDANGEAPIFISAMAYKIVVKDANDVIVYSEDDVRAPTIEGGEAEGAAESAAEAQASAEQAEAARDAAIVAQLAAELAENNSEAALASLADQAAAAIEDAAGELADSISNHIADLANPHAVTKTQVGLSNVDNTSDLAKPISTATSSALALKVSTTDLAAHTGNTSNPHSVTKAQVGLGSVDNTSDASKPISTAQAAVNLTKADKANPTFTGAITLEEITTPTTPSAGQRKLFAKPDGVYHVDSTGAEQKVGAGSGGGVNYFSNPNAESNLIGVTVINGTASVTSSGSTVDELGDSINVPMSLRFIEGQKIFYVGGSVAIGGLTSNSFYFVKNPTGNSSSMSFQLSATRGGAVIDLTSDGTGLQTFIPVEAGNGEGTATAALSRSTVAPLHGKASFVYSKAASDRRGDMIVAPFTVDLADQGRTQSLGLDYAFSDATNVNEGDYLVSVVDLTNKKTVYGPVNLPKHLLTSGNFAVNFQSTYGSGSYALIINLTSPLSFAYDLKFGGLSASPQLVNRGAVITDWVNFTPLGSWTSNTSYAGKYRRVGDSAEFQVMVTASAAPSPAVNLLVSLPAGIVIDTAKLPRTDVSGYPTLPNSAASIIDPGNNVYEAAPIFWSSTQVLFQTKGASGSFTNYGNVNTTSPMVWGSGDQLIGSFSVPILGWSSSQVLSSEVSGRRLFTDVRGQATSTALAHNTRSRIQLTQIVEDTTGIFNATPGVVEWTAPNTEEYSLHGEVVIQTAAVGSVQAILETVLNGSTYDLNVTFGLADSANSNFRTIPVDFKGVLPAGTKIRLVAVHTTGVNATVVHSQSKLIISNTRGSQQIAATEQIAASYYTTAGQAVGTGAGSKVIFGTKEYDTHGMVNASTGDITIPANGRYRIAVGLQKIGTTYTTSQVFLFDVMKAGVPKVSGSIYGNGNNVAMSTSAAKTIDCLQGEVVSVVAAGSIATNLSSNGSYNYISIERVN